MKKKTIFRLIHQYKFSILLRPKQVSTVIEVSTIISSSTKDNKLYFLISPKLLSIQQFSILH